jgi:hypothetical protein
LLEKGVYRAARGCLSVYGGHDFETDKENSNEGSSSKVDYVLLVDDDRRALCEATSPSVMHKVGQLLPECGIELKLFRGQSLIPKIFARVSTPFPINYNTGFTKICIGRFVSRSKMHGMAVSYLP